MVKLDKNLAEFYGILVGDGCISKFVAQSKTHHVIRIDGNSITDKEYYNHIKKLIFSIIKREVSIRFDKRFNGIFIYFEAKEFAIYLNKHFNFPFGKKGEIFINDKLVTNRLIKHVLRGLFDTDGCIYFTKNNSHLRYYPIIEISSHSNNMINQLEKILNELGFKTKIGFYKDSIKLHGKRNVEKWMKEIGSSNPHKFSKFKLWKKHGYIKE